MSTVSKSKKKTEKPRRNFQLLRKIQKTAAIILWRVLQLLSDIFIAIVFRGENEPLVPIREDCLLESATGIAAKIRQGKLTSEEAVQAAIRRIDEINDITNCVVEKRFEAALEDARRVDQYITEGTKSVEQIEKDTPFLGVPFTVKDGVGIEGFPQAAGVVARKNEKAREDNEAVALMRAAGAIPLATTNVPELSSWWETNNRLYGRTKNPYHSQYTAGGSSGGEAALIAAAGSYMGLGTDVGGSLRIPAAFCGIFAHKPSCDVVPDLGKVPPSSQQDKINVLGPMSKSAIDLRQMMRVLDAHKKLKLDAKSDLKKLRYFYMDSDGSKWWTSTVDPVDGRIKEALQDVIRHFNNKFGVKVEKVDFPGFRKAGFIWWAKMLDKPGAGLMPKNLSRVGIIVEMIKALLGFSQHTIESPWIWLRQSFAPKTGSSKHAELLRENEKLKEEFETLLGNDGVFFYPTSSTTTIRHGQSLFHSSNISYTAVFNSLKMPVTQCPITQTEDGLPIGIQIVAAPYQDHLTLSVAEELEKAFGGWKPPPSQPR